MTHRFSTKSIIDKIVINVQLIIFLFIYHKQPLTTYHGHSTYKESKLIDIAFQWYNDNAMKFLHHSDIFQG